MIDSGKIYEAISNVMAEIGAIGKEKRNQQQGFMYRGIDDVMNALQPALVKNKVFVTPTVTKETREERTNKNNTLMFYTRLEVLYRFYTVDGSYVETVVIGEAMDSGDKATNKAMSIAYKYACFQVFCIPTEEMEDPDKECHEPLPKEGKQQEKQGKQTNSPSNTQRSDSAKSKASADQKANPIPSEKKMEQVASQVIDAVKITVIRKELVRTGVAESAICERYQLTKLEECTEGVFVRITNALSKTKTKETAENE